MGPEEQAVIDAAMKWHSTDGGIPAHNELLEATARLRTAKLEFTRQEVREMLGRIYSGVQDLGGPGLHAENEINRQAALNVINIERDRVGR